MNREDIQIGDPVVPGQYVVYCHNQLLPNYPERKILMWFDGQWTYPMSDQRYRAPIYGWIGPIPILKLEANEAPAQEYDL